MDMLKPVRLMRILRILGWKIYTSAVVVGIIVGLGLAFWPDKPPIPGPIKAQLTSTLFVPNGGGNKVNRESAAFNSKLQLLTYKDTTKQGTQITISEQPAPSQFGDITGYYAQFATSLHSYDDFDSVLGHVYLVQPSSATSQAAVLYASGTLMFARPSAQMNGDDWRQFFRTMIILH